MEIVLNFGSLEFRKEIPEETFCSSDIEKAVERGLHPAETLIELACAGSRAIRKKEIKIEGNAILQAILLSDKNH